MSTDFNINLEQAKAAGVEIDESFKFGWGEIGQAASFPGYQFWRDISIHENEILLSCNGNFRRWLKQWLTENNIEFDMYPED